MLLRGTEELTMAESGVVEDELDVLNVVIDETEGHPQIQTLDVRGTGNVTNNPIGQVVENIGERVVVGENVIGEEGDTEGELEEDRDAERDEESDTNRNG